MNNTHNPYTAMIFDMDGVIWRNNQPIGNPAEIFKTLHNAGVKVAFATNNSTKTVGQYVSTLANIGVTASPDQIYTSARATAQYLKEHHPQGGNVYVVGMPGLIETLANYGFTHTPDAPLAVVVGMDTTLNYEKIKIATLLIRQGVPFIGTNPDKTFPAPEGLVPGAGSMLAAVQAATDVEPYIIGKPKPVLFEQALAHLQTAPEETLVIGDRLETDIAGGQAAGCKSALVLSGVSTLEMGQNWQPKIDIIADDLADLLERITL